VRPNGELIINDIETTGSGSAVEMIRSLISHFTPFDGPDGRIHKDAPNAEQLIMDKRLSSGMMTEYQQGNFYNACYFYQQLSPALKRSRFHLLIAISAATALQPDPNTGMTEAKRNGFAKSLIDVFRKEYPNDAAIELLAIDHYVNTKQFDSAIRSLEILDKSVGGDPYLDCVRAGVYLRAGDHDSALKRAEKAVAGVPDIPQASHVLADVTVNMGDYARAVKILDTLKRRFNIKLPPDSISDPAWRHFFQSEQYQQWIAQNDQ
jgi:hypothetical protein